MPFDAAGKWVPGPNDHHVDGEGKLQSGLGKDEPTVKQAGRMKANGDAKMAAMRAELESLGLANETREQQLDAREQALREREAQLERQLAESKPKPGASTKGA